VDSAYLCTNKSTTKNMKKVIALFAALLLIVTAVHCKNKTNETMKGNETNKTEKILFINGSPRENGNTAALAKTLLQGREYETLMLTDYRINAYGQTLPGDQLDTVVKKMKEADIVVIGSPVYWHNICASVRTVMERFYGTIDEGTFKGKKLFFLYQGAAPTKMMIDDGEYTMSRFAKMYGFEYMGMANNESQAKALREKL
jgi:putative NADPH-quinone reductase